jgi:hypothetical protein
VLNKVNEISRSQIIEIFRGFLQIDINIINTLMYFDNGLHNRIRSLFLIIIFSKRLLSRIYLFRELLCYLPKSLMRPVSEPVYDTPVVERRRGGASVREIRAGRVHREHDVQVPLHLLDETLVKLLVVHHG